MVPRARQSTLGAYLTTVAIAGTLCLGGCLSDAITKADAEQLVRLSAAFNRPKFVHVPRQLTYEGSFSSTEGAPDGVLSITELGAMDPTLAILKLNRAVSVSEGLYGSGREAIHRVLVTPIAIDSAALLADEDAPSGDPQEELDRDRERHAGMGNDMRLQKQIGWRISIGNREFLHVEQIHDWRDVNENIPVNELAVDFSWHWIPNEFGDPFDTQSESFRSLPDEIQRKAQYGGILMNTSGAIRSRAYLKREGKQWQINRIQW